MATGTTTTVATGFALPYTGFPTVAVVLVAIIAILVGLIITRAALVRRGGPAGR